MKKTSAQEIPGKTIPLRQDCNESSTNTKEKKLQINTHDNFPIIDVAHGFIILPQITEPFIRPTDEFLTLKPKGKENYYPKVDKLMKSHICISQPYYYYKKETNQLEYSQKFFFIEPDYNKLSFIISHNNNLFEVIPEFAHIKPYFDLEIEKNILGKECDEILELFLKILIYEYKEILNIILEKKDIVILNSCKPTKLSYHIIIDNGMYFENNKEQKCFIDYLKHRFNYSDELPKFYKESLEKFSWFKIGKGKDEGKKKMRTIFDMQPYATIQNFRCVGQSKFTLNIDAIGTNINCNELIGKYVETKNEKFLKMLCIGTTENTTLKITSGHQPKNTFIRLFNIDNMKKIDISCIKKFNSKYVNNIVKLNSNTNNEKVSKYKNNNYVSFYNDANDIKLIDTDTNYLYKSEGLTIGELKKMEKYKQYLYLICTQSEFVIWMAIGFAIASCGGTKEDWLNFSKLNIAEYVNGECNRFSGFRKNGQVFGLSYLKKLAILCNKDICEQLDTNILDEYFEIDTTGVTVIEESNDFVSHIFNNETQKYEFDDKITTKHKFLVLKAMLGKGKTTVIKKILETKKYKRILFLSPRITFSYFIKSEFDCDIYLKSLDSDKLVCQLESIFKLEAIKFDCIVIDESESVLKQFSSPTMKYPLSVWRKLVSYIKKAKKVILADAFVTRKTIEFCKDVKEDKDKIMYFVNTSKQAKRKAIQIKSCEMEDKIFDDLENDKKIYGCFSIKKELMELEGKFKLLQKKCKSFKKKTGLFYHAYQDDDYDKTLLDMNKEWKLDLVTTSPKITVGCSFSIENWFDRVYVKAKSSCCVRDIMQSIMRVRYLKEKIMYFSLPNQKHNVPYVLDFMRKCYDTRICTKKDIVDNMLKKLLEYEKDDDKKEDLERYIKLFADNNVPKGLEKILFFNMYEDYLSRSNYSEMFIEFLKLCNYDVCLLKECDKSSNVINKSDKIIIDVDKESYGEKYADIPDITLDRCIKLKSQIMNKTSNSVDKLSVEKYEFKKLFKSGIDNEILGNIFFNVFLRTNKKQIVYNLYCMKNKKFGDRLTKDIEKNEQILELQNFSSVQSAIIGDLVILMGLAHCHDIDTVIEKSTITELVNKYLIKNYQKIYTFFGLSGNGLDEDESKRNSQLFNLLRTIFCKWSGCNIKGNEKNDHIKSAKNYILNGITFYDILKINSENEKNLFI